MFSLRLFGTAACCSLVLLIFCTASAFVTEGPCDDPTSYKDILRCVSHRSFPVQQAKLEVDVATAAVDVASKRVNPELAVSSLTGKIGSENQSETDLSLGFPLELGGKRSLRIRAAELSAAISKQEMKVAIGDARTDAFLRLHRLRQLYQELLITQEARQTFAKLARQYDLRPQLSPEQQVSASIYAMAKNEYALKATDLEDEVSKEESFFRLVLGREYEGLKSSLPADPTNWPNFGITFDGRSDAILRLYDLNLELAHSEFQKTQNELWPTVILGPSMKIINAGEASGSLFGLNLSLPVPIFGINEASVNEARLNEEAASRRRELHLAESKSRRDQLVASYKRIVKALNDSLSFESLQTKHRSIETLFTRGVVPSSIVIEAHRSLVESQKARNEKELTALKLMVEIYAIDGKINEVDL